MAISPVASVSFRNNYNQVNFEGKNKKNNVDLHYASNTIKAIPLATLLALSPLNNVDAQTKSMSEVVNVQTYNNIVMGESSPAGLIFRYLNKDSDSTTIEKITADSNEDRFYFENPVIENADVKSVNNYVLTLVGADGKTLGDINHSLVELRGMPNNEGRRKYIPLTNEKIVNDITNFANSSKNNGAVEVRNIKKTLYGRPGRMPSSLMKPDTSWMEKTKEKNYNFGTLLGFKSMSTQMGNYEIAYYSTDGNNDDVETLVFTRDDGVRFKLDGLRIVNLKFTGDDISDEEPVAIGCIDISWPNVGNFTIFDNELAVALMNSAQSKDYAKAVNLSRHDYTVMVNSDGSLSKINK